MERKPSENKTEGSIADYLWVLALAVGMTIGVGIGAAIGSVGAGVGIGIGVGAVVGLALSRRFKSNSSDN